MRAFLRIVSVIAAIALAGPAVAETPEPSVTATARDLIESEGVTDLFEVVEGDDIKVRHIASRLTCHFRGNETTRRLLVFSGEPRGDDIGCAIDRDSQAITLYATRYAPPISVEQALADAEAGIRSRFPDAHPTPALLYMTSENLPEVQTRHFLITLHNEQWATSAFVAQSGDWIIKLRYTQRAIDRDALVQAQLEAGAIMTLALMEIQD